jgi:hypothetical protein
MGKSVKRHKTGIDSKTAASVLSLRKTFRFYEFQTFNHNFVAKGRREKWQTKRFFWNTGGGAGV